MSGDWIGYGIRGYRSFGGEDMTYVGPIEKVHLVVGRNNVGKSNLLHAMHDLISKFRYRQTVDLDTLFPGPQDRPASWSRERASSVSVGFKMGDGISEAFKLDAEGAVLEVFFNQEAYNRGHVGTIWFDFDISGGPFSKTLTPSLDQFSLAAKQMGTPEPWSLLADLTEKMAGSPNAGIQSNLSAVWKKADFLTFIPATAWVEAIRELTAPIESEDGGHDLRTGRGLVPRLAKLQNPDFATYDDDRAKFRAFERFVQDVLSDSGARVEIPRSETTIHVTTSGARTMPLHSLGTGIGEIIHLAVVATVYSDTVVCIEEPEIHLHPALQRKLISYLYNETSNRYLISTHSSALLNAEIASISHVTMEDGNSSVQNVGTRGALAHAVSDLGNRPSDLVQSNFLLWVEGPSDRIYVNHWLQMRSPELVEGAHYSIMFYGGALLNHLSVDDKATDEFIALLNINRNVAVLIDSDRKVEGQKLNATKERILGELTKIGAIGWVTDGYTVENYALTEWIQKAVNHEYKNEQHAVRTDRFASPLADNFVGKTTKPSKITVARAMVGIASHENAWHQDLWPHVDRLAAAITAANK